MARHTKGDGRRAVGTANTPEIKYIPIDRIIRDAALQMRAFPDGTTTDPEVVEQYRIDKENGDEFPDLKVVADDEHVWLWDGWHQIEAEEQLGRGSVRCEVTRGKYEDAVRLAAGANRTNGKNRTRADRRKAVRSLLRYFSNWTNARISRESGVDDKTVKSVREEMVAGSEIPNLETREGPDGKLYPATKLTKPPDPDSDDLPNGKLAGRRDDDGPAWTVPPPDTTPEHLILADAAESLFKRAEKYAESDEGRWFLGVCGSGKEPFVRDITGTVGDVVSHLGKIEPGYQTAKDRNTSIAMAHANAVDPMKPQERFGRCNWLREFAEFLRNKRATREAGKSAA